MRILHENPETACAKMSSFAHFVCIMLQFTAKPLTVTRQDLQWCLRESTWLAVCSRVALQI